MLSSKTWLILGIIITLLLGFTLGLLTDRTLSFSKYGHKYWEMRSQNDEKAKSLMEEKLLNRFTRKLDLSQPQIQAIGGILRNQSQQIQETRKHYRKKMKLIIRESHESIRPHLTPEQLEKFDKMMAAHKKRFGKHSKINKKEE